MKGILGAWLISTFANTSHVLIMTYENQYLKCLFEYKYCHLFPADIFAKTYKMWHYQYNGMVFTPRTCRTRQERKMRFSWLACITTNAIGMTVSWRHLLVTSHSILDRERLVHWPIVLAKPMATVAIWRQILGGNSHVRGVSGFSPLALCHIIPSLHQNIYRYSLLILRLGEKIWVSIGLQPVTFGTNHLIQPGHDNVLTTPLKRSFIAKSTQARQTRSHVCSRYLSQGLEFTIFWMTVPMPPLLVKFIDFGKSALVSNLKY
jgi:hypothetical protein